MKNTFLKIFAGFSYVAMIGTNFLANALPLNNRLTGEISDSYPNIFAPAGPAFAIWALIYLLLGGYVVYQFMNKDKKTEILLNKINPLFIGTALANIGWIFTWHYDYIGISTLMMAVLLLLLIKIADIIRVEKFTKLEKPFIKEAFSIYFGWITVAFIANITIFLVSIGWNGFGIADFIWTSIILIVGAIIGIIRMYKDRSISYGLILVWAYVWILYKHLSVDGFDGEYPIVIATVIGCLILLGFFVGKIIYTSNKK